MLRLRHQQNDEIAAISPEAEAWIRADERRRVLADRDERTAPLPPPAPEDAAPEDAMATHRPAATARTTRPDDDVRDEAWRHDDRADREAHEEIVSERGFSPGQLLILAAGIASVVLGVIAVVRTGLDGALSEPVETVLWWDHSALLGLVEIGAGALLILAALHPLLRWLGGLVGIAAIVGGIVVLADAEWAVDDLGTERDFGWVPIVLGAAAVLGALIPRVRHTRHVTVHEHDAVH